MPVLMRAGLSGIWAVDQNADVAAIFASQTCFQQQKTERI